MDDLKDSTSKAEIGEGDEDSANGNSWEKIDSSDFASTTDLIGPSSDEEQAKHADDNFERNSSVLEDGSEKPPSTTEANTGEQLSLEEIELDTSQHDSVLTGPQTDPTQKETNPDLTAAVHGLGRSGQGDSQRRPHDNVEKETLHRSSTRRGSFILAIESGEGDVRETDSNAEVSIGTGTKDRIDGGASIMAATEERTTDHRDQEEAQPAVEELEIFVEEEEENDCWLTIRAQCKGRRKWVVWGTAALLLAVVTTIVLIPTSIVYVEYYQMALARSRLTGRVDRGRTLYSGCYLFTPDTDLVLFKATAHHEISGMEVLTSDGLALDLELSLQYFIQGEELGDLHGTYGEQYQAVVRSVIESEVKNAAPSLPLPFYRHHRSSVESLFYRRLAARLQGDCCPRHCLNDSNTLVLSEPDRSTCNIGSCNPSPNCTRGLHMTLLPQHVQLGAIGIPEEVGERYLRFTLLQVEAEKESLLQESTVERKITEQGVKDIKNQAHEVVEEARASGRRVRLETGASAELRRQRAYSQALSGLMTRLNITATDHRLSLLLLLAYREVEDPLFFEPLEGISLFGGITT